MFEALFFNVMFIGIGTGRYVPVQYKPTVVVVVAG